MVYDKEGAPSHTHCILYDVTERVRVARELKESETRYRHLADSVQDPFFAMDHDLKYTYWNAASERLTGIPAAQAIGRGLYDLFPDTPPTHRAEAIYRLVLKQGRPLGFVNEYPIGDRERIFEIEVSPSEGGITVIARDVTARVLAERAVRAEKARAQQYLDIAGVAIVALDRQGTVTLANQRALSLLGYEQREILGRNWFDACLPDRAREPVRAVFDRLIAGEVEPVEFYQNTVLTRDGRERLVAWHNAVLRDDQGQIVGTLSSGEDITDRVQAEEARRESEAKLRLVFENAFDFTFR